MLTIDPPKGMNPLAMKAAAVSIMMAIFLVTEAISIFATSFLPIVLFPFGCSGFKTNSSKLWTSYCITYFRGVFCGKSN